MNLLHRPIISFRSIRPSDRNLLEQIHEEIFPIRYEVDFFQSVVNANDVVSWGAVDCSQPDGGSDELIGFVTARIVMAKDSEIEDILTYQSTSFGLNLVYILTLGVIAPYRNLGIATSLVQEVIKYASSVSTCRAVYLHVISYNNAAIFLYKKLSFRCIGRLHNFYFINGKHHDAYLFIYFVNGGQSTCSLLEVVKAWVGRMKRGLIWLAMSIKDTTRGGYLIPYKCNKACCLTSTCHRFCSSSTTPDYV